MVLRHPYVIGDFVWTGWDYMGESGIGHHYLAGRESQEAWPGLRPWPWYVSWCGDIDLTGREKAQSYFRDVLWGERHLALMVAAPVPEGMEERISFWGWPNELPSWNWEGYQGQLMRVRVFSSEPEVRLELNGEPVGSRQLDSTDRHIAEFELPYEPGLLQAISGRDGVDLHREILRTSGPFTQLQLRTEQKEIYADPNSLIFVRVQAQDSSGHEICTGTAGLEVELRGPCVLQAAGNGSPFLQGSFTDARFELFRGNGLVIIRSTGEPGTIEIKLATQDPDFPDPVRAQLQIAAR